MVSNSRHLVSLQTFADMTNVSVRTARRIVADRQITTIQVRGQVRVELAEIERFISENTVQAREVA